MTEETTNPITKLPAAIQKAADEADRAVDQIRRHTASERIAKRGRPRGETPLGTHSHHAVFVADNLTGLNTLMKRHRSLIRGKYRGNKRLGRTALYAELLQFFTLLKELRITVPRNGSLSLQVCALGIGDILRRHGCTEFTDIQLLLNTNHCRERLGKKMRGIFAQVYKVL